MSARKRSRLRSEPALAPSIDHLVCRLGRDQLEACSPAWSTHSNLLAVAAPPPPSSSSWLDSLVYGERLPATPSIHLTHFAGAEAATPRVRISLPVPVPSGAAPPPPASSAAAPPRVTHLSFSPDSSHLVAVVNLSAAADLITLYEQRGACIDEWDCVAQEDCARFSASTTEETAPKRVVSLRWVGESRRWYPAPTFPDPAREENKKPLYCAPPRSAPLEGSAFVAVLSSDEILFMHFPRRTLAAGGGAPSWSASPSVICLPLHSAPSPSLSSTSTEDERKADGGRASSGLAIPTAPTPVPLVLSLGPGLGSVVVPPVPQPNGSLKSTTTSGDTPSATVDALVSSLAATTNTTSTAAIVGVGSRGGGGGATVAAKPTDLGSGQAALHAELETQQELARQEAEARANNSERAGGRRRRVTLDKAAIGACRSRGTAELGETVFVVATWNRGGGGRAFAKTTNERRRRRGRGGDGAIPAGEVAAAAADSGANAGESGKVEPDTTATAPTTTTTTTGGGDSFMAEDDFALMVDFSSLDEAFGGGSGGAEAAAIAGPTIVPPSAEAVPSDGDAPNQNGAAGMVNGHDPTAAAAEQSELDEALAEWRGGAMSEDDEEEDEGGNSRWKVELTEVRVEMLNSDGPRVTVRPQAPLYLSPLPASSFDQRREQSTTAVLEATDPVLTHLTFLGDVALPHPLQQTTMSPTLSLDGSEAAVDLSLLAVTAHRLASPSSSTPPRWSSTLTSYALSKEEAYPLSDAFQTLEGRKVDAATQVEGEAGWVARLAACKGASAGGESEEDGFLSAVEIRPGGGEWASVTGLVATPAAGRGRTGVLPSAGSAEYWESRVVRLSSVTLEPLDGAASGTLLPGSMLYDAVVNSPNGAFVCALQHQNGLSPVIAAAPLGSLTAASEVVATGLVEPLAVRLAITIVRQGDSGDLLGRIAGLRDAEQTLAIVQRTMEVLQALMPVESMLESSALGMELLAIASNLYRSAPELAPRANAARQVLELAACVRALRKSEKRDRGGSTDYKPDADAIWPLVGHCVWYCTHFLDGLAAYFATDRPTASSTDLLLLHPRFRSLVSTAARAFLALDAYLASPESGSGLSDVLDLAKTVVQDAVSGALDGRGLGEWVDVLDKVNAEMDGGPAMTGLSPAPFWSLEVPESLQAQATRVRTLVKAALPPSFAERAIAPPSPPTTPAPTPNPIDQRWDMVRRARFSPRLVPARTCVRCGVGTAAVEGAAAETELVGQWRRFEAEWNGRCLCGGMWRRAVA